MRRERPRAFDAPWLCGQRLSHLVPATEPPLGLRLRAWLPFVASAALAAATLRLSWDYPWVAVLAASAVALTVWRRRRAKQRVRDMAQAGQTAELLDAWQDAMADVPHAETLMPLIHATAFTSAGQTERARAALDRAEQGPAWQSTREHRLIVETLLDAFEGQRDRALDKSAELVALPLPPVGPVTADRVVELRAAVAAAARAFAHRSIRDDVALLRAAARKNPLIHWPLRYATAIALIDQGRGAEVSALLSGAPKWPEDSAFSAFQRELLDYARSTAP